MDENKLLTAMEHIATGAETAAATMPAGSPHAMGWFARAKALIAEIRNEIAPPPPPAPDPADTSAEAMNAGEATANEANDPVVAVPDEQHPA